jgi:hypothetical protein
VVKASVPNTANVAIVRLLHGSSPSRKGPSEMHACCREKSRRNGQARCREWLLGAPLVVIVLLYLVT